MFFDCTYIYINILNTKLKKQQYVWYKKITVEKTKRNHWTIFSHMNIQTWLVMSLQHIFAYPCKMSQEWTNYLGMDCLAICKICKVRNVAISSSLNMANLR